MKPEGKIISDETLQECFRCNSDGAGFMYAEDNKLHIHKGYMDFPSFLEAYKKHQDKKVILHFRITTHGATNQENTHPFQVGESLGFVHNGIISAVNTTKDKTKSDTYHFNKAILKKIYKEDPKFIFKDFYQELISGYIGYSKLVFLTNKGEHIIINESKGEWDDGIWYSNNSYKLPVKKYQGTAYKNRISYPATTITTPLQVGSRVIVKGCPAEDRNGKGVIKYFGDHGSIGVMLDGNNFSYSIHVSYVFPDNVVRMPDFQVGDLVCRKLRQDDVGIVSSLTEHSCIVTFWDEHGEESNHLISKSNLIAYDYNGVSQ